MTSMETAETPRVAVSTTYHGTTVTEDYRWLEDAASEQTRSWTAAQTAAALEFLEGRPCYAAIRRRAEEISAAESVTWGRHAFESDYEGPRPAGSVHLVLQRQPPKQQPFLVALPDLDDVSGGRVLVDPNAIDETGATTIDWFVPSPDGRLVAVSLSSHGTEDGTLHLFSVETGEQADAPIPRVNSGTAGGSLTWAGDSGGFWYTRGPAPGERPDEELEFFQEIWHHTVGRPADADRRDHPEPLADPRIVEHFLASSPDGRWVMDRAQRGDSGEWQVFLRPQGAGEWWSVAGIEDACADAAFGD